MALNCLFFSSSSILTSVRKSGPTRKEYRGTKEMQAKNRRDINKVTLCFSGTVHGWLELEHTRGGEGGTASRCQSASEGRSRSMLKKTKAVHSGPLMGGAGRGRWRYSRLAARSERQETTAFHNPGKRASAGPKTRFQRRHNRFLFP